MSAIIQRCSTSTSMRTVDCNYSISEERLREYAQVPLMERLRWLDELVLFTLLWRATPVAARADLPTPESVAKSE